MTITEALAEIKTLKSRIEKKRESVMNHVVRDSRLRDPFEKEGGQTDFVRKEMQSIQDLEDHLVKIRCAIQKVNTDTTLEIEGVSKSVAYWLNWKREVSKERSHFLTSIASFISHARKELKTKGQDHVVGGPADIVVSISEQDLSTDIDLITNFIGRLDGRLSLLNATTHLNP